jgi:hypothetical protein
MELDVEALRAGDNCKFIREQRDYEKTMMKRIDRVVFALVLVVAASLIGLIIAIAVSEWGVTAATGIGTVVSGTAAKFIFDQRTRHSERVDKWIKALEDLDCPDTHVGPTPGRS